MNRHKYIIDEGKVSIICPACHEDLSETALKNGDHLCKKEVWDEDDRARAIHMLEKAKRRGKIKNYDFLPR